MSSKLAVLRQARTLRCVAQILGVQAKGLAYTLYHSDPDARYRTFDIPKRRGGHRTISAPRDELKLVQRRLADLLQDCAAEIEESRSQDVRFPRKLQTISHGFVRGRSIRSNARQHRNRRFVFNLDLEDFFPSINYGRVYGLFLKDEQFLLFPRVAAVLAAIACHDGGLPQGSPCSPVVSNLIGRILDMRLVRLCARLGCTYTRYVDDITISTNRPDFPAALATLSQAQPHTWEVGRELGRMIEQSGFAVNEAKTRMQYRRSRQEVTGLIVNERINVRSEYRRSVRAMVHGLLKTGSFYLSSVVQGANGETRIESAPGTLAQLHGMLGFIYSIDRQHYAQDVANGKTSFRNASIYKLYKNFLLYRLFFASDRPVLICEGPTDNIYIRSALRALRPNYPDFIEPEKSDQDIRVLFYKYLGSGTDRVLGLTGGCPPIKTFINDYSNAYKLFNSQGGRHPVILVVDNDEGGGTVFGCVRQYLNSSFDGRQDFAHLFGNLYIVATHPKPVADGGPVPPRGKGCPPSPSSMEDYFPLSVLGRRLSGRTFSRDNNQSGPAHYGKMDFAKQIVEGLTDPADFVDFGRLFERLRMVITAHASTVEELRQNHANLATAGVNP